MFPFTKRRQEVVPVIVQHEVARGGNLDLILRGTNGAINRLADGLQAIALALSTPQDNSTEVQRKIDELSQQIKSTASALDMAVKNQGE